MSGTTKDAMTFAGHLGANILRPTKAGDYYRIVFKFDSMRHYLAWEGSALREKWLQRYAEVAQGEQELHDGFWVQSTHSIDFNASSVSCAVRSARIGVTEI